MLAAKATKLVEFRLKTDCRRVRAAFLVSEPKKDKSDSGSSCSSNGTGNAVSPNNGAGEHHHHHHHHHHAATTTETPKANRPNTLDTGGRLGTPRRLNPNAGTGNCQPPRVTIVSERGKACAYVAPEETAG